MAHTKTKYGTIRGHRTRLTFTVYATLEEAVRERGELAVLRDVNAMNVQRARWRVGTRRRPGPAGLA